jgi:hypothetical protein
MARPARFITSQTRFRSYISAWGACGGAPRGLGSRAGRFVLLALALGVLACTTTFVVQQYGGAPLPPNRISILRVNSEDAAVIVSLDGESLGYSVTEKNTRVHIEMLPGVHELDAGYTGDARQRIQSLRFRTQPGRVYRLAILGKPPGSTPAYRTGLHWRSAIYEVDRDTDELLAELPLLPLQAPATAATRTPDTIPSAAVPSMIPAPTTTSGASAPDSGPAAPTTPAAATPTAHPATPAVSSAPAAPIEPPAALAPSPQPVEAPSASAAPAPAPAPAATAP